MKIQHLHEVVIAAAAAMLLFSAGSCGKQQPAAVPDAAADSGPVYEDLLGFLDGYASAQLAAGTDPTLVILSPAEGATIWEGEIATEVLMTFEVNNWAWPDAGKGVVCYIDDNLDDGASTDYTHTFDDVPVGMHQLCCVLTESGLPLANCEATDCSGVMITKLCDYLGDPSCDDGNLCSAEACLWDMDLEHRKCVYGVVSDQNCCHSKFDCGCGAAGWQSCTDGQCIDCFVDDDCDDDNPCTVGVCTDSVCSYEWISTPEGSCCTGTSSDQGVCNDGLYCTSDRA